MKHIGWCLDKIQMEFMLLPRTIDSPKDKVKSIKILDEVEGYAHTLAQLVMNPKLRVYLNRLVKAPIQGVRLQEQEVEELLKGLEHTLYLIDLYIGELRELIKSHSGTWVYKTKQIFVAVKHLFDKNKRKLGKEYNLAQNFKSKIRSLQHQFSNKANRLVETIDRKFGGERGELREEFKLALYNVEELKKIVDSEKHLAEFLK